MSSASTCMVKCTNDFGVDDLKRRLDDHLASMAKNARRLVIHDGLTELIADWIEGVEQHYSDITADTSDADLQRYYDALPNQLTGYAHYQDLLARIHYLNKLAPLVCPYGFDHARVSKAVNHFQAMIEIKYHALQQEDRVRHKLSELNAKAQALDLREHKAAYAVVSHLHQSLTRRADAFFSQPYFARRNDIVAFKKECESEIALAKKGLSKHRGWKPVLAKVAEVFASLVVFYPFVASVNKVQNNCFSIFGETQSSRHLTSAKTRLKKLDAARPRLSMGVINSY